MSKQQLHIDQLFRRYLRGDIGPKEEAELESYAQEDEALATAMQAIRNQPTLDHAAAVQKIKNRLPRKKRRGLPPLYPWAVAACVLLAVGTSLLWLPQWLNTSQNDIAMRKTESQEAANEAKAVAIEETLELGPDTLAIEPNPTAKAEPTIPTAKQKTSKKQTQTSPTPDKNQPEDAIEAVALADEIAAPIEKSPAPPLPLPTKIPDTAAAANAKITATTAAPSQAPLGADFAQPIPIPSVAGYITNEEGHPIEGVEVLLAGQPMGIRTDSSGFFALKGIQKAERITLSHPNYQSFTLSSGHNQRELQIALEAIKEAPDNNWMLEAARTTIYPNPPQSFAYPQQGMKALKKAIIQQIPTELRQGKIRISFTVDKSGKVGNITAEENTPEALLENIRNYLQQNSQWQIMNNGNEPVEVSILLRF